MATLKLFGNLRKHTKKSLLQISGANIQEVIKVVCKDYPGICDEILENGTLRQYIKVTINGHDISLLDGLDTRVLEDDQISIFPPIAGG
jgi:molybdopterin synthase sulfur carrier subunit